MKHFGLILTLLTFITISNAQEVVSTIEGKQVKVTEAVTGKAEYEELIAPYRNQINRDLDKILAYNPNILDKTKGQWQSNIGDLLAQVTFEKGNKVFEERTKKKVDVCVLNHGGIRAMMGQGNVSARNAFEVMPFENSATVIELEGKYLVEFVEYFIKEKKPHPIAGLTFTITADGKHKDIKVNNEPIVLDKIYNVVTNDYLASGGDKMEFFKKAIKAHPLDYKLRDMLIDYFIDVEVVKVPHDIKVIQE
ncbi:MAG: 5'-nucleotidase [Bacteroidota bacterium]